MTTTDPSQLPEQGTAAPHAAGEPADPPHVELPAAFQEDERESLTDQVSDHLTTHWGF